MELIIKPSKGDMQENEIGWCDKVGKLITKVNVEHSWFNSEPDTEHTFAADILLIT